MSIYNLNFFTKSFRWFYGYVEFLIPKNTFLLIVSSTYLIKIILLIKSLTFSISFKRKHFISRLSIDIGVS